MAASAIAVLALAGCADDAASTGARGGDGPSANPDPFCSTRPKLTFCEDFDASPIPGAFSEQVAMSATMTIEPGDAASAPSALHVVAQGSAGSPATGALSHSFPAAERLRLFAQLRLPAAPPGGDAEIGAFELPGYRIGFGGSADGTWWAFEDTNGTITRIPGTGSLQREVWVSVRWDVNLYADGTGTGLLRFGNETIVDTETLHPPRAQVDAAEVTVGVSRATGAWDLRLDNVTIEIEDR